MGKSIRPFFGRGLLGKKQAAFSSSPWFHFHLFLVAGLFLSYAPLPGPLKWGLGLAALAGAFGWALWRPTVSPPEKLPFFKRDWIPSSQGWFAGILLLGVLLRFAGLTSFFTYPLYDDVLNAFFAYRLDQHWTWHPFFYYSQMPPLYIWMFSGWFKAFGVTLPALFSLAALVSLSCVPLAYLACGPFFSRSLSLACGLLTAASFWPLWLGRLSHPMGLMLPVEWLCLWLLGKFLYSPSQSRVKGGVLLGLAVGLGFYTYFAWPVAALFTFGVVVVRGLKPGWRKAAVCFFLSSLAAVSPLLAAALPDHFGFYVTHRWLSESNAEWSLFQSLYYPATLFWEGWKGSFAYAPRWGGFLNPVLGAFFFLGAVEAGRLRREPLTWALAAAFALFLLPVLLTDNYSATRLTPLLPLCLIGACFGIQKLGLSGGGGWKRAYLALLILFSLLLDGRNLAETRAFTNACKEGPRYEKSVKAYDLISTLAPQGPGAVFLDFTNDTRDRSLSFLTYPFNVTVHTALDPGSFSWAAVLADEEYQPFLNRRFPGLQWHWLDLDSRDMKGGILFVRGIYLGVIPLSPGNRATVLKWIGAGRDLEDLALSELNYVPPRPHEAILRRMDGFYGDFKDDGFLRSFYWEKAAEVRAEDGDDAAALEAIQKALEYPYARGYLCQEEGRLLVHLKLYARARQAFLEAGRLDPRFKPSAEVLRLLDRLQRPTTSRMGTRP